MPNRARWKAGTNSFFTFVTIIDSVLPTDCPASQWIRSQAPDVWRARTMQTFQDSVGRSLYFPNREWFSKKRKRKKKKHARDSYSTRHHSRIESLLQRRLDAWWSVHRPEVCSPGAPSLSALMPDRDKKSISFNPSYATHGIMRQRPPSVAMECGPPAKLLEDPPVCKLESAGGYYIIRCSMYNPSTYILQWLLCANNKSPRVIDKMNCQNFMITRFYENTDSVSYTVAFVVEVVTFL